MTIKEEFREFLNEGQIVLTVKELDTNYRKYNKEEFINLNDKNYKEQLLDTAEFIMQAETDYGVEIKQNKLIIKTDKNKNDILKILSLNWDSEYA